MICFEESKLDSLPHQIAYSIWKIFELGLRDLPTVEASGRVVMLRKEDTLEIIIRLVGACSISYVIMCRMNEWRCIFTRVYGQGEERERERYFVVIWRNAAGDGSCLGL